jgi:hypothetical protein
MTKYQRAVGLVWLVGLPVLFMFVHDMKIAFRAFP